VDKFGKYFLIILYKKDYAKKQQHENTTLNFEITSTYQYIIIYLKEKKNGQTNKNKIHTTLSKK